MSTVKTLYEVTYDRICAGYMRVYVWCGTEIDAVKMALKSFADAGLDVTKDQVGVMVCFRDNAPYFATKPSDCGWEVDDD